MHSLVGVLNYVSSIPKYIWSYVDKLPPLDDFNSINGLSASQSNNSAQSQNKRSSDFSFYRFEKTYYLPTPKRQFIKIISK